MHKSDAITRQVHKDRKRGIKMFTAEQFIRFWFVLMSCASALGHVVAVFAEKEARKAVSESWVAPYTVWKPYMDSLWAILWAFKFISVIVIYYETRIFDCYKKSIPRDFALTILFFIFYHLSKYLYAATAFKSSGHAQVLTMVSFILIKEIETHNKFSKRIEVKCIALAMLGYNCYIFFWTALAFHTYAECVSGSAVGFLLSFSVYTAFQ